MARTVRQRRALIIRTVLATLLAGAVLAFAVAWSGIYSIAASRGHWAIVEWGLTFGMRNSVKTHSLDIEAPALDNPDLVTLGAGHFHSGCAYCHGAPGVVRSPIAQAMLPPPPDLATSMRLWKDRELFWIVKNGIKYTGMPAWAAQQRDDEVWAVVAFVRHLPQLDPNGYRDLALGGMWIPPQSGREVATTEDASAAESACARCHGAERSAPKSALVPILHGQPAEFLVAALKAYAAGDRPSGIMQPVANDLLPESVARVAEYYARLAPPTRLPAGAEAVNRGRALAELGDTNAKIPSCTACHNAEALKTYPRLAGQSAAYMANRLRLWKRGVRSLTDTDAVMAPIAGALDERQIDDVTAYFASLAPGDQRR
jgi:cytochrome c553